MREDMTQKAWKGCLKKKKKKKKKIKEEATKIQGNENMAETGISSW